jgi:YVTN family beta-propeller protein
MAVSAPRNLLFVTNRESGDLTILDIETRQLAASVHVGGFPREVLLTSDDQYALVLDTASGSVAVIHIDTVLDRRVDIPAAATALSAKPLFTTFATAGDARSSLILPSPLAS